MIREQRDPRLLGEVGDLSLAFHRNAPKGDDATVSPLGTKLVNSVFPILSVF